MSDNEEIREDEAMDEEEPDMDMAEAGDGVCSDDDDLNADDDGPPGHLPDGVQKEVVRAADAGNWRTPRRGDEVCVHYVGRFADGTEFDSSRARAEPFTFTLGKGKVIVGWDLGVASMKKGELAKFTLSPEYAYGEKGSPPKIPGNATLVFEIELLSWTSKTDLFADGGVVKTQVTEGSGWKRPRDDGEVLFSFKVVAEDATVIEERKSFEYKIGSDALGPIGKAVDKALVSMKKEEEGVLNCRKDYAYGESQPNGCTIELQLHEIYETSDISFASGSITKKQVKEGEGYDTPMEGGKVKLLVDRAVEADPGVAATTGCLPGFESKALEFVVGDGEVCDALECAVVGMKKGERSVVTCDGCAAREAKLGLDGTEARKVAFTVELQEFETVAETHDMSDEDKVAFAQKRKAVGATLFAAGRVGLALERYKKVVDLLNYADNMKGEYKDEANKLKQVCELNKAACFIRLQDFAEAKKACNAVLKDDRGNVKGLFRRAQADFELRNIEDCMRDLKQLLQHDPQNKEARVLLRKTQAAQKEEDKRAKGLFVSMCRAFGEAEPGKKRRRQEPGTDEARGKENNPPVDGVPPKQTGDSEELASDAKRLRGAGDAEGEAVKVAEEEGATKPVVEEAKLEEQKVGDP